MTPAVAAALREVATAARAVGAIDAYSDDARLLRALGDMTVALAALDAAEALVCPAVHPTSGERCALQVGHAIRHLPQFGGDHDVTWHLATSGTEWAP